MLLQSSKLKKKESQEMTSSSLHVVAWNVNELAQFYQELVSFLRYSKIDVAFLSETHCTNHNYDEVDDYLSIILYIRVAMLMQVQLFSLDRIFNTLFERRSVF